MVFFLISIYPFFILQCPKKIILISSSWIAIFIYNIILLNIDKTRINQDFSNYSTKNEDEYHNKKHSKITLDIATKKVKDLFEYHFIRNREYLQNGGFINFDCGNENLKWDELQKKLIVFDL